MKRIYVPMPDEAMRLQLLTSLFRKVAHALRKSDFDEIVRCGRDAM